MLFNFAGQSCMRFFDISWYAKTYIYLSSGSFFLSAAEIQNFSTGHQACKYLEALPLKYLPEEKRQYLMHTILWSDKTGKFKNMYFLSITDSRFWIPKKVRVIQICVRANLDLGEKFPRSDNLDRWTEKSIWYTCGLWLTADFETNHKSWQISWEKYMIHLWLWLTADFWANHRPMSRVLALLTKIENFQKINFKHNLDLQRTITTCL